MRYSGWPAIFAATVWPTSPAPTMSTRSWNDGRVQMVTRVIQRATGRATMAMHQKAISITTGAASPSASTSTISSTHALEVSAVSPLNDSPRLNPPMLRPGSRYRPKTHRAASQYGVNRAKASTPVTASWSKGPCS